MPVKEYAEFLAAVNTGLNTIQEANSTRFPHLNLSSCMQFNCNNSFWATYSFTEECPEDPDLRREIVLMVREKAAKFKHLRIIFYPDKITDSRSE